MHRNDLEKVAWFTAAEPTPHLSAASIPHGFVGVRGSPGDWHHLKQIHGARVVPTGDATAPGAPRRDEADGLFTTTPGQAIAIKTADCVPLLLVCPQRRVAAAAHGGWRGLVAGIVQRTVLACEEQGSAAGTLLAAIGPAIGQQAFEVGSEVIDAFASARDGLSPQQLALCVAKGRDDRWHIDLPAVSAFMLINAGLAPTHVAGMRSCSRTHPELWHSYRRDGDACGSNWSWISL